jgi:hypothetical protein
VGIIPCGARMEKKSSTLMNTRSVPVAAAGNEFPAGNPSPLFPARLPATTFGDLNFLAVSRDGSRFYIPQAVDQPESDVIHVRIGWAK